MSDTLVYAMSSKGSMKIEWFNELFRYVYFPSIEQAEESFEVDIRRQTIRILDSLGFCEFDFNKRMIYMCKPALILLPFFGLPRTVLVGARSPALIEELRTAVKIHRNKASLKYFRNFGINTTIPTTLCIEAIDVETIHEIAKEARIACKTSCPAAWALANISSSFDAIKGSLRFESKAEPNWKRRIFSKKRLVFSGFRNENSASFLAEYKDPVSQQLHHWLWKDGASAPVGRDWGRYVFLALEGVNILLYDEKLQKFAVPVTVPLPCILARTVSLCTGTAPSLAVTSPNRIGGVPPGHSIQVYSGIPNVIAKLVASKLSQKLIYTHFEIRKGGVLYA